MPIGHSSFEGLKRRRLRPSLAGWSLAAAGAGILGSSAIAIDPYDVAALGILSFATGLAAWRGGRQVGLAISSLAGPLFLGLELWRANLAVVESLRAVPGLLGLLALAVALAEVGHIIEALAQSSMLDQVTRLPNYALFTRFLEVEVSRSMRYRLPFCLVCLEIQDLDSYSRTYGYWRTDALLRELAKTMAETLRRSDVLGRIGGPQFALLLPMTKADGAGVALKRVESAISVLPLPTPRGTKPRPITWKAAIAEFPEDGQEAANLLRAAGQRLGLRSPEQPALPKP